MDENKVERDICTICSMGCVHNHISTHIPLETHKLCITSIQWEKLETEVLYMSNAQGTH